MRLVKRVVGSYSVKAEFLVNAPLRLTPKTQISRYVIIRHVRARIGGAAAAQELVTKKSSRRLAFAKFCHFGILLLIYFPLSAGKIK